MEATMRTLQVTLPLADAAFLRRQSRNMGWHVITLRQNPATEPKVKMTEDEFRVKLAHSSAQYAAGKTIAMQPEETPEQFIDRLIARA